MRVAGGGGGLVDHLHHVEARDPAGLARRLSLGVGEVRGNGDHGAADRAPARPGGPFPQRLEQEGGDFLGRVLLLPHPHAAVGTHQTLDREHRPLGRRHRLIAGLFPDDDRARLVQTHARRQDGLPAFAHHLRPAAGDDRHFGVGRPDIDPDDRLHDAPLGPPVDLSRPNLRHGATSTGRPGARSPETLERRSASGGHRGQFRPS